MATSSVNVPKLMNGLMADLQTDARERSVKLVADVSTNISARLDELVVQECLSQLVGTLIRETKANASISLITAFESEDGVTGFLRAEVHWSSPPSPRLEAEVAQATDTLARTGATLKLTRTEKDFALVLLVPEASLDDSGARVRTAVVVDDDVDTQEFLAAVLESQGFRVVSVSDGFDALLVIERYQPDVVLTDILMPNMNGLDLVSRIKSVRADLPVIVFSGYREALVKNIAGLPDRILPKPMSRDQVLKALDSVLSK